MKKRSSSLLSLILVVVVLLLQLAGSNSHLHGYLHGTWEAASSCSHPDHPCGPVPADKDEDSCGDNCAVDLLAGGLVLTSVFQAEPVRSQFAGKAGDSLPLFSLPGSRRLLDARAPPVL